MHICVQKQRYAHSRKVVSRSKIRNNYWVGSYHGDDASDEAEIHQVVGIHRRRRVNLQAIITVAGVLEEAVHGVEHLVRQVEEPLPANKQ